MGINKEVGWKRVFSVVGVAEGVSEIIFMVVSFMLGSA